MTNSATRNIEVDPEIYEVRADGELLTCDPAEVLHGAKVFLFERVIPSTASFRTAWRRPSTAWC